MILKFVVGFGLSAGVGLIGYWRGSLSRGGVIGAILLGTVIFGFGGIAWGALLVIRLEPRWTTQLRWTAHRLGRPAEARLR